MLFLGENVDAIRLSPENLNIRPRTWYLLWRPSRSRSFLFLRGRRTGTKAESGTLRGAGGSSQSSPSSAGPYRGCDVEGPARGGIGAGGRGVAAARLVRGFLVVLLLPSSVSGSNLRLAGGAGGSLPLGSGCSGRKVGRAEGVLSAVSTCVDDQRLARGKDVCSDDEPLGHCLVCLDRDGWGRGRSGRGATRSEGETGRGTYGRLLDLG